MTGSERRASSPGTPVLFSGPRLGFGGAPLGNMFRAVSDSEARATVDAVWDAGVRYFDTAPAYGAGLSEVRLGDALAGRPRASYVLSTKVGHLMTSDVRPGAGLFADGLPYVVRDDYTADATLRSLADSMERLRTDRIDVVWVHNLAQNVYGDAWIDRFAEARTGAFRVLDGLRDEGTIGAWGLATNLTEPIEVLLALDEARPDVFLLAGRYTLLDHEHALQRLLPAAVAKGVRMVVGAPYSSGILAGGAHYEYAEAPPAVVERVTRIQAICTAAGVSLKAVALQFCLAHPATAAVIPGASRPERIQEDLAALTEVVPEQVWKELIQSGLISPAAFVR